MDGFNKMQFTSDSGSETLLEHEVDFVDDIGANATVSTSQEEGIPGVGLLCDADDDSATQSSYDITEALGGCFDACDSGPVAGGDRWRQTTRRSATQEAASRPYHTGSELLRDLDGSSRSSNDCLSPATGKASSATVDWLRTHYEERDGVSVARSVIYSNYVEFCSQAGRQPLNAATFGKITRAAFPYLKTRRLGNRGNSKYHYDGISVKDGSPYRNWLAVHRKLSNSTPWLPQATTPLGVESRHCRRGAAGRPPAVSGADAAVLRHSYSAACPPLESAAADPRTQPFSPSRLPLRFPTPSSMLTPESATTEATRLLAELKGYYGNMLDAMTRADLDSFEAEMKRFCRDLSDRLLPPPSSAATVIPDAEALVLWGNAAFHGRLAQVLIPTLHQSLPAKLLEDVRFFAKQYPAMVARCVGRGTVPAAAGRAGAAAALPLRLAEALIADSGAFSALLHHEAELSFEITALRNLFADSAVRSNLAKSWSRLATAASSTGESLDDAVRNELAPAAAALCGTSAAGLQIASCFRDLLTMLMDGSTVDNYLSWATLIAERYVNEGGSDDADPLEAAAVRHQFLLSFQYVCRAVMQHVVLWAPDICGPMHLLTMTVLDHVVHLCRQHELSQKVQVYMQRSPALE